MFVTAVCVLFLIKLRWPKKKNFYDSLLLLHILLTAYRVANCLRNPAILNLFSPRTAYPVASYTRYTATLILFIFARTAYRVPRSQPFSLTHSMWRGIWVFWSYSLFSPKSVGKNGDSTGDRVKRALKANDSCVVSHVAWWETCFHIYGISKCSCSCSGNNRNMLYDSKPTRSRHSCTAIARTGNVRGRKSSALGTPNHVSNYEWIIFTWIKE